MLERRSIAVSGVIQGVGFRPYVYRLARGHGLSGFVRNDASGVAVEIEGSSAEVAAFLSELPHELPPLARVERSVVRAIAARGDSVFRIASSGAGDLQTMIPPDTATCDACLAELFDRDDRRYRYPFLNCTHCGPRLTILTDLPYDRSHTSMEKFALCSLCRIEYENPDDRRFHAQPTACPVCGPRLRAKVRGGSVEGPEALAAAVAAIQRGEVVALKGLGGYHLACDGTDPGAVSRLRARKGREAKPLALMVRDVEAARELCEVSADEAALLRSPRRPIVLLRRRSSVPAPVRVVDEVAPDNPDLGLMLPYTPLHHLLVEDLGQPLVMTSANMTDEPMVIDDGEAQERLCGVADLILAHDRPIQVRCDDSVTRVMRGDEMLIRRSRGYAPDSVRLPRAAPEPILAVGGHLKNVFCLARGNQAFLSPHVGDLETLDGYEALSRGVALYERLLGVEPRVIAHDLHPDYLSTRYAREREADERIAVQHHHAHVAACAAEHGVTEPVIGVAFDGSGYGPDGAVWGGEFLIATATGYERFAHLDYVALPGGEAAVRQPWRVAASHLVAAFEGSPPDSAIAERLVAAAGSSRWDAVVEMARRGIASPYTSSVGRLFDGVAALLGLCTESRFEAEAAIALELVADTSDQRPYPVLLVESPAAETTLVWDPRPLIRAVVADLERGRSSAEVAGRFHATVASAIVSVCERARDVGGPSTVALTGGVFQNVLLVERAAGGLEQVGFRVLLHRQLPPNDGGLSFGQTAVAVAALTAGTNEAAHSRSASDPGITGTKGRPLCV